MSVKVVLASSHQVLREGLCRLIERQGDIKVVGEAGNGQTALKLVRELRPDVAIIDIVMPNLNGTELARRITAEIPNVKVLVLPTHNGTGSVLDMLKAGASGYLSKESSFEEVVRAIHAVLNNDSSYLSPRIATFLVNRYINSSSSGQQTTMPTLTDRERLVLQLVAEGKSTKQIALQLHVSIKTIEANRRQIMNKLDIQSVAGLTKYAIREGLTSLDC